MKPSLARALGNFFKRPLGNMRFKAGTAGTEDTRDLHCATCVMSERAKKATWCLCEFQSKTYSLPIGHEFVWHGSSFHEFAFHEIHFYEFACHAFVRHALAFHECASNEFTCHEVPSHEFASHEFAFHEFAFHEFACHELAFHELQQTLSRTSRTGPGLERPCTAEGVGY